MQQGFYFVLEGIDGCGKTTVCKMLAEELQKTQDRKVITVRQPGSTPLGEHLRKLAKYPHTIDPNIIVDDLSYQTLMMIDSIALVNQVLIPELNNGSIIIADRSSFIGSLAYGLATNIDIIQINRLAQLIKPPLMDRLYVIQCPWKLAVDRMKERPDVADRFDKDEQVLDKVQNFYDNILTGPPERSVVISHSVQLFNIKCVDGTKDINSIYNSILKDIYSVMQR